MSPIYSFEYDYDAVGNRTRLGREYGDTYYTYDEANELVTETDSEGATSYEFDANGNQSAVTDANGTTYYEWTPENMLSRIDFADGGHNYFEYDGNLGRVRKDDSAGTTKYTWDGLNILLERDAADQPMRPYVHGHTPIYGIGSLVAHEADGELSFYHQDQIGSTRNLSDAGASEVAGYQYAPFGTVLSDGRDPSGRYLLSGKAWDGDADAYHFRFRQYGTALGRFLSRDPLDGMSRYLYCSDAPLNIVDPFGLQGKEGPAHKSCDNCQAIMRKLRNVTNRVKEYCTEEEVRRSMAELVELGITSGIAGNAAVGAGATAWAASRALGASAPGFRAGLATFGRASAVGGVVVDVGSGATAMARGDLRGGVHAAGSLWLGLASLCLTPPLAITAGLAAGVAAVGTAVAGPAGKKAAKNTEQQTNKELCDRYRELQKSLAKKLKQMVDCPCGKAAAACAEEQRKAEERAREQERGREAAEREKRHRGILMLFRALSAAGY